MKRYLNLVRSILLEVELQSSSTLYPNESGIKADKETLARHVEMLKHEGWLSGEVTGSRNGTTTEVHGLTWKGHDMLCLMRLIKRWSWLITQLNADEYSTNVLLDQLAAMARDEAAALLAK